MISTDSQSGQAEVQRIGALELAYLGDSVFDLYVRECLIQQGTGVHEMHQRAIHYVNAQAQADAMERLMPHLSSTEQDLVRRGRNAKPHHAAPHRAGYIAYSQATALEALVGYLYLSGQTDRLRKLLRIAMEVPNE